MSYDVSYIVYFHRCDAKDAGETCTVTCEVGGEASDSVECYWVAEPVVGGGKLEAITHCPDCGDRLPATAGALRAGTGTPGG